MLAHETTKPVSRWAAEHPGRAAGLRVAIGIWLLCVMTFLYESGHGGGWAWLLAVGTVVHFGLAYRQFRIARTGSDPSARLQYRS